MRRKQMMTLGSALLLIGVAAFSLWPDTRLPEANDASNGGSASPSATTSPSTIVRPAGTERDAGLGVLAADAVAGDAAKKLMQNAEGLAALPEHERVAAANRLVQDLRASGAGGLSAMRAYLASGRDVALSSGYRMEGYRFLALPSLRATLLNSVADWDAASAMSVWKEALAQNLSSIDAAVVLKHLELLQPGQNRETALALVREILQRSASTSVDQNWTQVDDAVLHFQLHEVVPQFLQWAKNQGREGVWMLPYIEMLPDAEAQTRKSALWADTAVRATSAAEPSRLTSAPIARADVQAFTVQVFKEQMTAAQKEQFLTSLKPERTATSPSIFQKEGAAKSEKADAMVVEELHGDLAVLDQVRVSLETETLLSAWEDTYNEHVESLALKSQGKAARKLFVPGRLSGLPADAH